MESHIIYIKMYIKSKMLKVVYTVKHFCRNFVLVTNPHWYGPTIKY